MNDEILLSDSLKDVLDYNSLYDIQNNEVIDLKIWNNDNNFALNSIKKIKLKKPNMIIDEFTFTAPVNVVNFMLTNNYKIELKFDNLLGGTLIICFNPQLYNPQSHRYAKL